MNKEQQFLQRFPAPVRTETRHDADEFEDFLSKYTIKASSRADGLPDSYSLSLVAFWSDASDPARLAASASDTQVEAASTSPPDLQKKLQKMEQLNAVYKLSQELFNKQSSQNIANLNKVVQ